MSKLRSKRHKSFDADYMFILVALVICEIWAHKAAALRLEHLGILSLLMIGAIIVALKVRAKFRPAPFRYNLSMTAIDKMTGLEFEKQVAYLLVQQGYKNIQLTERYDLGIDIIAEKAGTRWGIQVKRYSGLVKASAVRQTVTALPYYHCDRGMVVTNSVFSRIARTLASSNSCVLLDRDQLARWISTNN